MKTLLGAKKFMITLAGLGSVMVLAGVINDINYNSISFMEDQEIKIEKRFDDRNMERIVASAERDLPKAQYLPMNDKNKAMINGKWEITRIVNENKEEVHSVEKGDAPVPMNFEMIGTSFVRINDDEALKFDISFLHESGTRIALFRSFGVWYEIIEARKISESQIKNVAEVAASTKKVKEIVNERGVVVEHDEMVIERALFSKHDSNILRGELVSGYLSLGDQTIEAFQATIGIGKEYEASFNFIGAEINAGGQFEVGEGESKVSGIITRNGEEGYRVRFVSGPLEGALLNFTTENEKQRILEQEEEAKIVAEEKMTPEQVQEVDEQEDVQEMRRNTAIKAVRTNKEVQEEVGAEEEFEVEDDFSETEGEVEGEQYTKEEVAEKTNDNGFNF